MIEIRYLNEVGRRELMDNVRARHPSTVFNWVCFENDLETANANCRNDLDRDEERTMRDLAHNAEWTTMYEYPEGAIVLKMFRLPPLDRSGQS